MGFGAHELPRQSCVFNILPIWIKDFYSHAERFALNLCVISLSNLTAYQLMWLTAGIDWQGLYTCYNYNKVRARFVNESKQPLTCATDICSTRARNDMHSLPERLLSPLKHRWSQNSAGREDATEGLERA